MVSAFTYHTSVRTERMRIWDICAQGKKKKNSFRGPVIGKRAYHMAKCKKKIPNYRSSLILCVVIEELRVVKGLVAYGLGAD